MDVLDAFTVRYPATWPISGSEPQSVTFDLPQFGLCTVYYPEIPLIAPIGSSISVNSVVTAAYRDERRYIEKLLEKGSWTTPVPIDFALVESYDTVYESTSESMTMVGESGNGNAVVVRLFRAGGVMSAIEIEQAQYVLASFRLE